MPDFEFERRQDTQPRSSHELEYIYMELAWYRGGNAVNSAQAGRATEAVFFARAAATMGLRALRLNEVRVEQQDAVGRR